MSELGEIRAALAGVTAQIGNAYEQACIARTRIADAVAVLSELGEQHSEPVLPDELRHAADELERGLGLISTGAAVVADIDARL